MYDKLLRPRIHSRFHHEMITIQLYKDRFEEFYMSDDSDMHQVYHALCAWLISSRLLETIYGLMKGAKTIY